MREQGTTLYITGAGVSADSGIPTFRGHDGYWTIGSRNYTPQEMATRAMYLGDPAQFLLWYYRRFAAYRHVQPNAVHHWLAGQCNAGQCNDSSSGGPSGGSSGGSPRARLITQNIDGLDGKAGNRDYISIHGRLNKMTLLHDQSLFDQRPSDQRPSDQRSSDQPPDHPDSDHDANHDADHDANHDYGVGLCDAPWDEVAASLSSQTSLSNQTSLSSQTSLSKQTSPTPADPTDPDDPAETNEAALIAALLAACRIPPSGPQMGVSLKPYVLLFDEYYTDLYRMTEAERWMNSASRMVFMGTSFSVNITAIALRTAVQRGIPVEIVDPEPIDLAASFGIPAGMADISYHAMTAEAWVQSQG